MEAPYVIYNLAVSALMPPGAAYLAMRPAKRPLLQRIAPKITNNPPTNPLWLHACSVGEINAAKPLIKALRQHQPDLPLLLTVSTIAGRDLANAITGVVHAWCPYDHPCVVAAFLKHVKPRALMLLETELWPNILRQCSLARIPSMLVNGRISDRHFPRYRRARWLVRPMLKYLNIAAMQNAEYAERIISLGMPRSDVHVTGSMKFDGLTTEVPSAILAGLIQAHDLDPAAPLIVFGSTRPGDEALAKKTWLTLKDAFPQLKIVIAPRHIDRIHEAMQPFNDEPVLRRSHLLSGKKPHGERVIFLDTIGELTKFYALATVAVVAGSFYPGVNGHNPLEPAALRVPTVFGPYMRNFIDPARELINHDGAIQTPHPDQLPDAVKNLLQDKPRRSQLAKNAEKAIAANKGAIERTLNILDQLLETPIPVLAN